VFSYLEGKELGKAQCVCKNWMRLAEDHVLWEVLFGGLCDEDGAPLSWNTGMKEGVSWKQRYFISSRSIQSFVRDRWQAWLSLLQTHASHAMILGNEFHVHAISPNFKISIVDLDDIFKGVGVKGSFPVPRLLSIDGYNFTVLSSMHSTWTLGFWLVARDLKKNVALVIVRTKKLVLVSMRERCNFSEHIQLVQGTLKAAELLINYEF